MTTEMSVPPQALDADDLFALIEEYGGEMVFDMMFETGDGVTDSGRMAMAMVIASYWLESPTDVTDEQLSFLTSAVRRDTVLWGHYYMAEPYDNVALDHVDGVSASFLNPLGPKETKLTDDVIAAAQADGIMGEKGGNWITGEHYDWAYRPEYYLELTPDQRQYVGLIHDLLNPMLLGQAGLDAGDSRLDDAVLDMTVRNGHASEAEYRENGVLNRFFNITPIIHSGGLAADPGPWTPEQYGGNWEETQRNIMDLVAVIGVPAVTAGKAVGIFTSQQAARATAAGFTAQSITKAVAAEHAPALLSRQMALLGSKLRGMSEAQWWGTLTNAMSTGYRTLAKRGAIVTGAIGGTATLIDTWRNLALPQVVTNREDSAIMANVALEAEQANFLTQGPLDPLPPLSLSSGVVTARGGLTALEDRRGVLVDETGRPVVAPPHMASIDDSDADITGEPATATEYLDNPYVGFDNPRYFDFNADGTPQIEQLRRRESFEPWELGGLEAGFASPHDKRFETRSMPRWHVKDIERELGNMTSGDLMWFQAKAVEAGLINPAAPGYLQGSYRDEFTRSAMESLMWRANRSETETGLDWRHQLEDLARLGRVNAEDNEQKRRFIKASYLAPDPAELAVDARNRIRSKLGRDINDWELEMISEHLLAGKREQHEATQDFRYNQFLAQGRAEEEDLEFVEAEPVDDVNWEARTSEFMEKRFGAEAARAHTTTEVAQETPDLMTGLRRGIAGMS